MNEILIGKTLSGMKIALPVLSRTAHVQIIGSTGRGKTESVIIPWMVQDMIHSRISVLIDGKGDQSIYELLRTVNEEEIDGKVDIAYFDIGNIESSMTTNPLRFGSPQQIVDRLFSSLEFENIYFKNVSFQACLMVVKMMQAQKLERNREVTFKKLALALTDDGALADLFSGLKEADQKNFEGEMSKFLNQKYSDRQEKLSGLISQIEPFASGELAEILNGKREGKESFALPEIIFPSLSKSGKFTHQLAVILIPTLLYQQSAAILGKMFLQEIAWTIAMKEKASNLCFASIFLDEFSSFVYPGFLGILNKARSTNTAFHISHQSLGDLTEIGEGFAGGIHTNTNIKCVLGLNDPETADFFAKHFGTRDTVEATERAKHNWFGELERSGELNVRSSEAYKIHPNKLKSFSQGRGVFSFIHNGHQITEEVQFWRSPFQLAKR